MEELPEPVVVVAALVERLDPEEGLPRLFLARRAPGLRHGGLWELPGGKVEPGEEAGKALLRELEEELGLAASLLGPPRDYQSVLGGRRFRFLVFPTKFPECPAILAAHDACVWAPPGELAAYELAPLDGPAVRDWLALRQRGKGLTE